MRPSFRFWFCWKALTKAVCMFVVLQFLNQWNKSYWIWTEICHWRLIKITKNDFLDHIGPYVCPFTSPFHFTWKMHREFPIDLLLQSLSHHHFSYHIRKCKGEFPICHPLCPLILSSFTYFGQWHMGLLLDFNFSADKCSR